MANAAEIAAARAEGYSDAEIAQHLGASAAAIAAGNPPAAPTVYDPSAGGGTLSFGPIDTGIHTPEWLDRLMAGTGRGMVHTVNSLRDLVGDKGGDPQTLSGLVTGAKPQTRLQEEAQIDAPLMKTTAGKIGNAVGETAITAPLGMGAGAAIGKAAPLLAGALPQGVIRARRKDSPRAIPGAAASTPCSAVRVARSALASPQARGRLSTA